MKHVTFFVLLTLVLSSSQVFAWGNKGHKITAIIARSCLEKQVIDSVQHYLGEISFEEASVWMDEVRSDRSYDYMKPMHYVNIEKDKTYVKVSEPNVINELELVIGHLRSRKARTKEEIKADLLILFHLVGDIHQPLHTGYADDKGGNSVEVDFLGRRSNLHRVWDTNIIEEHMITSDTCMKVLSVLTEKERNRICTVDVMAWAGESRALLPMAYSFKDESIDKAYIQTAAPFIEKRLAEAGIRLASVLNEVFGAKPKALQTGRGGNQEQKKN